MIFMAYALIWVSMAAVVSVGIEKTGNWHLIWFMLIPLFAGMIEGEKDD